MDQFDDDHAYQLLFKAFGAIPYVQREYWGIHKDFKLDSIWSDIDHEVPTQIRTGNEETTIPSVDSAL
jgi:hypothetical protein